MDTDELEPEPHDCQEEDLIEVSREGPDYWGTIVIDTECEVCGRLHDRRITSIL